MTLNPNNTNPRAGGGLSLQVIMSIVAMLLCNSISAADLQKTFQDPPQSAKPWTYWFWMNGNVTREGITADLEAMSRVGIGGVLIMEVANPKNMAPDGPIAFASPQWRELFKHVISECRRLGMQVNMNNDAGWCGSGGPWMTPELSMQDLVATNIVIDGPAQISQVLPRGEARLDYYRDVKVLALPLRETQPAQPGEVLDLSNRMDTEGRLTWDAPAGRWKILRIGVTTTGAVNKPAPVSGQGLECDKFNIAAINHHFKSFIGKLADDNKQDLEKVFTLTHIDSWEVGDQDWTGLMAREFRQGHGYDVTPWLAAVAGGETLGDTEMTERFQWDFTRTKAELNVGRYANALRSLAHDRGLKLSIEAYNGKGFLNPLTYGAAADLPMAEFWIMRWGGWHVLSSRLMASVGHVHGKPIIGAEAFTSWAESDPYSEHPYSVKTVGDWAFCEGINQFVFHRTVMDPWTNTLPGMTFAGFGWHVDRNQTWWEPGAAYMRYLTRCQALLQSGQFVADVLRLVPAGEKFGNPPHMRTLPGQYDPIPAGYNHDYISDKAFLGLVRVKDSQLVTMSGMRYRMLQLPNDRKLTPILTRKIRDLVRAGALVYGPAPVSSPSLENYPKCDEEVRAFARETWGNCDGERVKEHAVAKGRVVWGTPVGDALKSAGLHPDFAFMIDPPMTDKSIESVTQGRGFPRPNEPDVLMPTDGLNWIHRRIGNAEVYFVANPQHREVNALCTFRVKGMQPEVWDPLTGQVRLVPVFREAPEGIRVPLHFDTAGSCFVVFRRKQDSASQIVEVKTEGNVLFGATSEQPARLPEFGKIKEQATFSGAPGKYELVYANGKRRTVAIPAPHLPQELSAPWVVRFQTGRGAPPQARFAKLADWSQHPDEGIRYFSGSAAYTTRFDWPGAKQGQRVKLDLGEVQVMAEVRLNGRELGTLWKPPFELDVTEALRKGSNELEVQVYNLWPNRLIGDEQFPDDCTPNGTWKKGRLPAWPEWFLEGRPRPEPRRLTFTTWKYYTKGSPLLKSGLLGPVRLISEPFATIAGHEIQ